MIFSAAAKVMGLAKGSPNPARWPVLIVLFCVTASCERAYAMNDLPDVIQEAVAHWWSPTAPNGVEFELPSGTKTCSVLKVRFVGQISWVAMRVGPGYPDQASFLVEDNLGDQQYSSGKITKASFYVQYNDVHFGHSEMNQKLGASGFWFRDRNNANLVLKLLPDGPQPETPISYVCAFKEGERVLLSYFLKNLPPHP